MNLYGAISPTLPDNIDEQTKRLILFDPTEVYERVKIDKYKRWQYLSMPMAFPNQTPGKCACGCGTKLAGRQTRWAHPDHCQLQLNVIRIMNCDTELIKRVLRCFMPYECSQCHCEPYNIEKTTIKTLFNGQSYTEYWSASGIHVDHKLAIINGGGGCWLGNFRFLCHKCHGIKTGVDKQIRNKPSPLPFATNF